MTDWWERVKSRVDGRVIVVMAAVVALLAPVAVAVAVPPVGRSAQGASAGQLYAFGENKFGQLGNAMNINTEAPNPTPALVGLSGATGTVTQVAVGFGHSLVLSAAGQLYAFGDNDYGQVGNAINIGTGAPNPTPTAVMCRGQAALSRGSQRVTPTASR
jgi:Regulator of chromosome condensation (RCC1) repeat